MPALSLDEIRDWTAELDQGRTEALRRSVGFLKVAGPIVLGFSPELRPGAYHDMLAALRLAGLTREAQEYPAEFDESYFRLLMDFACAVESCLGLPSTSTLVH
jgi:hypothetical protein